jgi:tRNA threonylcarbamoyladenosine biosynthesis protein TsaB
MAALAQTVYMREGCTAMWVAIDARMQQTYWANYHVINGLTVELQGLEQLVYPSEVLPVESDHPQVGIGDGWGKYEAELSASIRSKPSQLYPNEVVQATALLPLARQYFEEGKGVTADQALPVYLR